MKNKNKYKGFFFLLIPLVFLAVTGIVMLLWNALLPEILGVKSITYWQAMGILVLSKILFGGFHGKSEKFGRCRQQRLQEKMDSMTDDEKEKFRQKFRERFGNNPFCSK